MTTKTKPPQAKDPEIVSSVHEQIRKQTQELNEALMGKPQPAFGPGSDETLSSPNLDLLVEFADRMNGGNEATQALKTLRELRRRPEVIQKSQEERDDYAMKVSWSMLDCTVSVEMAFLTAWKDALRHARNPQNGGGK